MPVPEPVWRPEEILHAVEEHDLYVGSNAVEHHDAPVDHPGEDDRILVSNIRAHYSVLNDRSKVLRRRKPDADPVDRSKRRLCERRIGNQELTT